MVIMEDIDIYLTSYKDDVERSIEQLLELCRYNQKQWDEDPSLYKSGVRMLLEAYETTSLTTKQFVAMLPAVINYEQPYEITFNYGKEPK